MRSIRLWFTRQPYLRSIALILGVPYRSYTAASSTILPVSRSSSSRTTGVWRCTARAGLIWASGLAQDRLVEFGLGHEPLEPGVLLLQFHESLGLIDLSPPNSRRHW
jgi:hypothetical protein